MSSTARRGLFMQIIVARRVAPQPGTGNRYGIHNSRPSESGVGCACVRGRAVGGELNHAAVIVRQLAVRGRTGWHFDALALPHRAVNEIKRAAFEIGRGHRRQRTDLLSPTPRVPDGKRTHCEQYLTQRRGLVLRNRPTVVKRRPDIVADAPQREEFGRRWLSARATAPQ
ncbi:MAG: hypothetical protein R3C10_16815 [Pirellulales bacterium]